MEQGIINYLTKVIYNQWDYIRIPDDRSLEIIYNLLINKQDNEEEEVILQNPIMSYYYGIYYQRSNDGYLSKRYYKKAIENEISEAMTALGYHYYLKRKYDKMTEYYLMAIKRSNKRSMYYLGLYYFHMQDQEQMEKYLLMAIDHHHVKSMSTLADYYGYKENFDKMKLYYQMAVEHGDINSMLKLGKYYENNNDYQQMEVYYLMAINRGHNYYLAGLAQYYYRSGRSDEAMQYELMMIEKYNNNEARFILMKSCEDNLTELIYLYRETNNGKEKYSEMIIKNIPLETSHFRFKDGSIGMRIMNYHFKINQGSSETLYQEIKENNPLILDYLNISDSKQVIEKIEQYLNS